MGLYSYSNDRLTNIIVLIFFGFFFIGLGVLGYISGDEEVYTNLRSRFDMLFRVINWIKFNTNGMVVLFVFGGIGLWLFYKAYILFKGRKNTK